MRLDATLCPIVLMETRTALFGEFRRINPAGKTPETGFEFGNGHFCGTEVNVEQRAKLPRFFAQEASFTFEPLIQRCPRKGRQHSDLHFVKPAFLNEFPYIFE